MTQLNAIKEIALKAQAAQTELNAMLLQLEPEKDSSPEAFYTVDELTEMLKTGSKSTTERLLLFAPKLEPEEVASQFLKMQITKIGRENRVSTRAYKAFVNAAQGQKIETTAMSRKAKLQLSNPTSQVIG